MTPLISMKRTQTKKNIGISFGEIKHFNDGIGEFSRQFGLTLAARAPELKKQGVHLHYHLPKTHHGLFGTEVEYLHARSRQRHIQIRPIRFDIWHSLNQHIRLKAPIGTRTQILTLHDLNLFYFMTGAEKERALKRQLKNLRRADTIVTISDYVKQDLNNRLGWSGPVHRIYNGVRSLLDLHQEALPELVGQPFFFHLSRMASSKNVEALARLAKAWPEKRFVFAGAESDDSKNFAKRLQADNITNASCYFDISDAQKAWLYQHCEAFLLPSLTEGFGLPTIEAMYFGKPVFLSDRTCMPEIGGDKAYYWHSFEPHDMQTVIEAGLRQFHSNASQPRLVQQHAAQFSWSHCIDQYVELYLSRL